MLVLYEDAGIIIFDKIPNIYIYKNSTLVSNVSISILILLERYTVSTFNINLRFGILQRLDRNTTGILLIIKNNRLLVNVMEQLKNRKTNKYYLVISYNTLAKYPANTMFKVRINITFYQSISLDNTLLNIIKCKLYTGVLNQIRIHIKNRGIIIGDNKHGKNHYISTNIIKNKLIKKIYLINRYMLNCYIFEFTHYITNSFICFATYIDHCLYDFLK